MLIHDDCLNGIKTLAKESVDMIYLDPPFFTQKYQMARSSNGDVYGFSDIWDSRQSYLLFLKERLSEMRRVLKDTGSIFFHCDTSSSHYIRILLDEIFGEDNFRSEIIWTYKRWSNSKKGLLAGHQTIFFYSKSPDFKFHVIYGEYSPTTNLDQILQERERNAIGKSSYKRDKSGNTVMAKEKRGVPMSDVWDIPFLNPKAKERVGYPTQKPIELLQRILRISTDEDDLILDPFCGSGTALVAAKLMGRNFIGIDTSADAINLCQERISNPIKTESTLLKVGTIPYQTKTSDELAILSQFECDIVQRNKGIDAFLKKHYLGAPVAIKIQKQTESIQEAISLLSVAGLKKGCSYTILIRQNDDITLLDTAIPANMIVINSNRLEVEQILENRTAEPRGEIQHRSGRQTGTGEKTTSFQQEKTRLNPSF